MEQSNRPAKFVMRHKEIQMKLTYDPLTADALIQRYRVPGATKADYAGAVHLLLGQGWSVGAIAIRLQISDRTVQRYRDEVEAVPDKVVTATYSDDLCNCKSHEYTTKRSLYSRSRKECTAS
jgi:hypothetical protein